MSNDACKNPVFLTPQVRREIDHAKPKLPKLTLTPMERKSFFFSRTPEAAQAVEISTKGAPGNKLVGSVSYASTAAPTESTSAPTKKSTWWMLGLAAFAGYRYLRGK